MVEYSSIFDHNFRAELQDRLQGVMNGRMCLTRPGRRLRCRHERDSKRYGRD
jgi:hypothetical protein